MVETRAVRKAEGREERTAERVWNFTATSAPCSCLMVTGTSVCSSFLRAVAGDWLDCEKPCPGCDPILPPSLSNPPPPWNWLPPNPPPAVLLLQWLQCCYSVVTVLLQCCYSVVTVLSQWCCSVVALLLQCCYSVVVVKVLLSQCCCTGTDCRRTQHL